MARGNAMRVGAGIARGAALACLLLLGACGSPAGPPDFVQAFGTVDSPCAIGAPPSDATQHCVADLIVVNHGGDGYGHATIEVRLKDARPGAVPPPPVRCGTSIRDTPAGGSAILTCNFDLAPGESVSTFPSLSSIDFSGAGSSGSSSSDMTWLAIVVLAAATLLLGVAVLISVTRRRPDSVLPAERSSRPAGSPAYADQRPEPRPARPNDPDVEYDLPRIPS